MCYCQSIYGCSNYTHESHNADKRPQLGIFRLGSLCLYRLLLFHPKSLTIERTETNRNVQVQWYVRLCNQLWWLNDVILTRLEFTFSRYATFYTRIYSFWSLFAVCIQMCALTMLIVEKSHIHRWWDRETLDAHTHTHTRPTQRLNSSQFNYGASAHTVICWMWNKISSRTMFLYARKSTQTNWFVCLSLDLWFPSLYGLFNSILHHILHQPR